MKPFKNLLLLAGMAALLFACEDEVPTVCDTCPPPPENLLVWESFSGTFQLDVKETIKEDAGTKPALETFVIMEGEGKSTEFGKPWLTLSHLTKFNFSNGIREFKQGTYSLIDESGNTLSGTYSIRPSSHKTGEKLDASITNGTGKFKGAIGNIYIEIRINSNHSVTAYVKGKMLPADNPVPSK